MSPTQNFHIADYCVFILALVSSLAIGLYHGLVGGKDKSNKEYMVGKRDMALFPVAVSMVATFVSGQGLLGTPAEVYSYGTQYVMHIFAALIGNCLGAWLFVPLFYPLKLTSCYEYLEMRYKSRAARVTANIAKLLNQLLLNGVAICAPAIALQAVTGVPVGIFIVVCGATATLYTAIGGMKAVVWTDVVQSSFIFVGLMVLTIVGVIKCGGLQRVWELNHEWDRIEFFNMSFDPTIRMTFWTSVFGIATLYFCLTAIQPSVQRFCSLPTMKLAKKSLYMNFLGLSVAGVLCCGVGIVAFAYFAEQGCDPVKAGKIRNSNQILPYFVMEVLTYPGLPGLFVACLASAALSTSSSTLNACGTMVWKDLLSHFLDSRSEKVKSYIIKCLVVCIGGLAVGMAFIIKNLRGTFIQIVLGVAGSILGPITGIFVLGAINPKAGGKAGLIAMFLALSFNTWLNIGSMYSGFHTEPLPSPIDRCVVVQSNSTLNLTISDNSTQQHYMPVPPTLSTDLIGKSAAVVQENPSDSKLFSSKLEYLFSFSYLYYPIFGINIVLIVGSLLSLIPGFRHDDYVPDELLFPCVRYLRQKLCGSCIPREDKNGNIYKGNIDPAAWRREQEEQCSFLKVGGVEDTNIASDPAQHRLVVTSSESIV